MKKLYSLALGLLAVLSANAGVKIGDTSYDDLYAAVDAASDGAEIVISDVVELTKRLNITKNLTIVGADATATIKVPKKFNGTVVLLPEKIDNVKIDAVNVTFSNFTYDGNSNSYDNTAFEIGPQHTAVFNDVTIANVNQTGNRTFTVKGNTTLNNVSFENCTYSDGIFNVLAGNDYKLTVKGSGEYNVNLEKGYGINADNFTGKIGLNIQVKNANKEIVKGGSAENFYILNPEEGWNLIDKGGNVVLEYAKNVVTNETTGVSYTSFAAAYEAAEANDVLVLLEDLTLAERQAITKAITIKGQNSDIKIIRNFGNNILFNPSNNCHLTLENLVIDSNNKGNNKNEFEAGNANITLSDVKIINSVTTQSLIWAKDGRTVSLNNVTVENCSGQIGLSAKAHLILDGDNTLNTIAPSAATSTIEVAAEGSLTNTTPLTIAIAYTPEAGAVLVKNCTDASKFDLESADWHLESDGTNLVLAAGETTGIDEIVADDNAPVEYYNLQGIRVANPENGIFIRRQGNKATKVAL